MQLALLVAAFGADALSDVDAAQRTAAFGDHGALALHAQVYLGKDSPMIHAARQIVLRCRELMLGAGRTEEAHACRVIAELMRRAVAGEPCPDAAEYGRGHLSDREEWMLRAAIQCKTYLKPAGPTDYAPMAVAHLCAVSKKPEMLGRGMDLYQTAVGAMQGADAEYDAETWCEQLAGVA